MSERHVVAPASVSASAPRRRLPPCVNAAGACTADWVNASCNDGNWTCPVGTVKEWTCPCVRSAARQRRARAAKQERPARSTRRNTARRARCVRWSATMRRSGSRSLLSRLAAGLRETRRSCAETSQSEFVRMRIIARATSLVRFTPLTRGASSGRQPAERRKGTPKSNSRTAWPNSRVEFPELQFHNWGRSRLEARQTT